MLELAFTDPLADSHSAAPDALGQSPTAGSTANKGSASSIPTIVMVLRFPCRLNGSFQGVSADQGPIVIRLELPPFRHCWAQRQPSKWVLLASCRSCRIRLGQVLHEKGADLRFRICRRRPVVFVTVTERLNPGVKLSDIKCVIGSRIDG